MICKECINKPLARGIKFVTCFKCGNKTTINYFYHQICKDCSNMLYICEYCGKEINNAKI